MVTLRPYEDGLWCPLKKTLPVEDFGWPTCAEKAGGAGLDQMLPPPEKKDLKKLNFWKNVKGPGGGSLLRLPPLLQTYRSTQPKALFCTVHLATR